MSLTSYRTAPPRVTDFPFASDTRSGPLTASRRKPRNDFAALSGRCGEPHQPAEPRSAPGKDAKILKEASLFTERHAFGFADLAAIYSPVP